MPLLTLDAIALAFGHLPLVEGASVQIDAGERIALIGRNGSGKSSLLKVISGEVPPDSGTVWRAPGIRVARLDQELSVSARLVNNHAKREGGGATARSRAISKSEGESLVGSRTVFDEIADGLGDLGDLVAAYHRAAVLVAETAADSAAPDLKVGPTLVGTAPDLKVGPTSDGPKSPDVGPTFRSGAHAHEKALERLAALQQQLEERDGWRLEQKVELVISRLGLPADQPVGELSGGWRRRVLLGRALVSNPDVLLLDEPTNHLDIDAIRWLEEYLADFAGALLFVTHDRAFLGALATRIIELDRGTLTSWPGSYERYLEKKAASLENETRDLARLDRKLAQEEAWLRQGVKARRTRNEGRVKALMALRSERAAYRQQAGSVRLGLDSSVSSGKLVFEADRITKSFHRVVVIRDFSVRIQRGDRIGLIGANGSGKSTLLRLLLGELEPDRGTVRHGARLQVAYFDQQREQLDPEATVADSVNEGNTTVIINGQPRHIIGYLADFLFPRERAMSPVKSLSGGERNRLLLARLFAKPANVLVLDEPTNDLDIETLELLEELISNFDGTVLLVSHDRVFLDRIVTSTLAFEGEGRVVEYVGGWQDYLRQTRDQLSGAGGPGWGPGFGTRGAQVRSEFESSVIASPGAPSPHSPTPNQRKLSYNEQRELEALPPRIEALEAEQARLRKESESPDFYKESSDHIRSVLARLEALGPELDQAIARWMELEERS